MTILYLIVALVLNSFANIFLKMNAINGFTTANLNIFQIIWHNYKFFLSLIFFALNVVFYFLALRRTPISTAYPTMVVASFFIINSYAYFYLGEKINLYQIFGYALIVIGIVLIFAFPSK